MLFLALPILASVGFTSLGVSCMILAYCMWLYTVLITTVSGAVAALWQSIVGIGPVFNLFQSATTGEVHAGNMAPAANSTTLDGFLYDIITLVIIPPKKLEWWETDEFIALTVLAILLLLAFMLGLKCGLRRRR
jgi:hypothetical protein